MRIDRNARSSSRQRIIGRMPFVALTPSARLALWGLRYWSTCARQGRCPALLLRDVYASAGVPYAPVSLDRLMRILTAAGMEGPGLGCPTCTRLTDDEADILNAMLAVQDGDDGVVIPLLGCWLPPHAAAVAGAALSGYARLLLEAGYDMASEETPELQRPPQGARLH